MDANSVYLAIAQRIDEGPLGVPRSGGDISAAFIGHLKLMYNPPEAEIVQHLMMPYKFQNTAQVAAACGKAEVEVKNILDALAKRGAILGFGGMYCLLMIPQILNYFSFYPEVRPGDLEAGKLYQQYFIKEGFYKYYETSEKGTPIIRVIPVGRAIQPEQKILDTEEAHKVIEAVKQVALVPCPCRTRTEKLDIRECRGKYPIGSCIMLNNSAQYFVNAGMGKLVTQEQAIRYLDEMQDLGLVATTENFNDPGHDVICLCCDCCCSQLRGRTRWENPAALLPSNFVPEAGDDCIMCGECVGRCFFDALSLNDAEGKAVADPEKCVGCGVCTLACAQETLKLKRIERSNPFPGPRELYKTIRVENQSRGK